MGNFSSKPTLFSFFFLVFSPNWGENFFFLNVWPWGKTPPPPFSPPPTEHHLLSFSLLFSLPLYHFTTTKHTIRVCLFGGILGRMENLGEKNGERKLGGCLVRRRSGKFCSGAWMFSPGPTKKFSPQNWEKIRGRICGCLVDKNAH